jgi:hypothetical protein
MITTRNSLEIQLLDEIGGEALDGSGFENETPDAPTDDVTEAGKEHHDVQ